MSAGGPGALRGATFCESDLTEVLVCGLVVVKSLAAMDKMSWANLVARSQRVGPCGRAGFSVGLKA